MGKFSCRNSIKKRSPRSLRLVRVPVGQHDAPTEAYRRPLSPVRVQGMQAFHRSDFELPGSPAHCGTSSTAYHGKLGTGTKAIASS